MIPLDEIPWGITGYSYATAPFTHINPAGSRFSDGSFGVLYVAEQVIFDESRPKTRVALGVRQSVFKNG